MNSAYTDISYLRRYVNGELSPREMFDLERAAHQDEMLMDLILGLEFEKSRDLPNSLAELQQRIQARVQPVPVKKPFAWAKWSIAATFFIAVIGAALYFTRNQQPEIPAEIAYQPEAILGDTDTSSGHTAMPITPVEPLDNQIALAPTEIPKTKTIASTEAKDNPVESVSSIDTLASTEHVIASVSATPTPERLAFVQESARNRSVLLDSQALSAEMEEVTIARRVLTKDSPTIALIPPVQQLAHQKAQVAPSTTGVHDSNNLAHVRAKISSMNIDPQTSMVLHRVLDQQARENQIDIAQVGDKNVKINPAEGEYLYLANIKSFGQTSTDMSTDQKQVLDRGIVFNESTSKKAVQQQTSIPKGGWKFFDGYIGSSLQKKNITSGQITYLFKLDDKGVPQDIYIQQSSDTLLNSIFVDILRNGPTWEVGSDSARVTLELKF